MINITPEFFFNLISTRLIDLQDLNGNLYKSADEYYRFTLISIIANIDTAPHKVTFRTTKSTVGQAYGKTIISATPLRNNETSLFIKTVRFKLSINVLNYG